MALKRDENTDRRILHTKKFIREALLNLLRTRNISEISISLLCKEADINRKTFYAHYNMVEDVLKEISDAYLKGEKAAIVEDGTILKSLQFIGDHREVSRVLLLNPEFAINSVLKELSDEAYEKLLKDVPYLNERKRALIKMSILSSHWAIVKDWLDHDCDLSVEEVSEIVEAMTMAILNTFHDDR